MDRFATYLIFTLLCGPLFAQEILPDRRVVITRDVDFYGADLQALFDTDLTSCQRLCLNNPACKSFTFNSRSNACFPKGVATERREVEGAISGVVIKTEPAAKIRARNRLSDLDFLDSADFDLALAQARDLGRTYMGGKWSVEVLRSSARNKQASGDLANAMRWSGAALAQTDAAVHWVEFAGIAGLNANASERTSDRRKLSETALSAAVNGYVRAGSDQTRSRALIILSEALEMDGRGRAMISALRLAQNIQPQPEVMTALDSALAKYGFRITEHRSENDRPEPRICVGFSEDLVQSGLSYAPYVKLPDPRLVVSALKRELCIGGVEHGKRYAITFRKGLPAASGETMRKEVTITQYIRDRAPSVAFPGRAYVLPRSAEAGLPIETINVAEVDLSLRRVSDSNLLRAIQDSYFGVPMGQYSERVFEREIGETIWEGKGEVEQRLNREITTRLPIGEVLKTNPPGIYALTARVPFVDGQSESYATQWFVLSDLGLASMSGADGLHAIVHGLSDARARQGVSVQLISQANRVLAQAQTDAFGRVLFDPGLIRGTHGDAPALLVAKSGDDIAFLSLTDPAFDLSDRGVEGREHAGPVDVFLATDRGAYRAGEAVHATALTRDRKARAIDGLPLIAVLTRPDGVEYSRHLSQAARAGGHVFDMPTGEDVPRGSWRIEVYSDPDAPALASQTILIEDFQPERIDFDLTLPDGRITAQDRPELTVDARYLFGAPGADLPVEIRLALSRASAIDGWPGYIFGRHNTTFDPRMMYLEGDMRTDKTGNLVARLAFPEVEGEATGLPLQAEILVSMSEGSGRPVERHLTRQLAAAGPVLGIKPLFHGVLEEGAKAQFRLIGLDAAGKHAPMDVNWKLNRVHSSYEWYQLHGQWKWEATVSRTEVAGGQVSWGSEPIDIGVRVDWGNYELVVERRDGDDTATSMEFWAGWYAPADVTTTPDTLEVSLDQPRYHPGETARLRLAPRYDGTAVISVMSDRVIAMHTVAVTAGENIVPLPVTEAWGAGAYVSASVIRPMDASAGQNPARAIGLAYAKIDPGEKALGIELIAVEQAAPRGPLTVEVKVDGIARDERAFVTIAATDLGILNITGFQSPDPQAHFFGQRKLGMELRDLYGRLINGLDGSMGQLRSGGDSAKRARRITPPPTEETLALFSGPLEVDAHGRARVTFDVPEFNGTVRLAAIAWSHTGVGQAEADVLVSDPVIVTASLPRFLAPGDVSRLLLEVVHAQGPSGRMAIEVTANGVTLDPGAIPSVFELADLGKAVFTAPLIAGSEGDHSIQIVLTTPSGTLLRKSLKIPVRDNTPEVARSRRLLLAPGETFTLDDSDLSGLVPNTASALVAFGRLARFDAPRLLEQLNRYPYGCTEQITSQALPLLYMSALAEALGLAETAEVKTRIDQTIARVLTRQAPNGAFGLWHATSEDFWLDSYVSDFLGRARLQGFTVPDLAFRQAMDNLKNRINYAPDFDNGGEDLAYALFVLAREGTASVGDLRYFADVKGAQFATPLAAAQLGAALAMYGDQSRADKMFRIASQKLGNRPRREAPDLRGDFGSDLRDAAGLLTLAAEAGSDAVDRATLITRISATGMELSTQEQAWSLLAALAVPADPGNAGILLDGAPVSGPLVRRYDGDMANQTITNASDAEVDITVTTIGQPAEPAGEGGFGYRIERNYYTMDGAPLSGDIKIGDRLVTVVRVFPAEVTGARLMIDDPLPAGLEIDNPNLLRAGDIRALDWLNPKQDRHVEFRADRFLAAVDLEAAEAFDLAYIVRAISPGRFHHPAAAVHDMYRPRYRARTADGQLVISE